MVDQSVSVARLNPFDSPAWDLAVDRLPGATVFHTSAWARVLRDSYGYTPTYLVAYRGTEIDGVLPIMEVDSWLTGRRGVTLPFSDSCEPLVRHPDALPALFEAALAEGRLRHWRYYDLHGGRSQLRASASVAYYQHRLDLTPGSDALWAAADSAVRRAVRKAEQSRLQVEFGHSANDAERFYGLVCRTRRRQGLPPQPRAFFRQIHRHLLETGKGVVVLATLDDQPVAGALFLHHGSTAVFKFGASDETYQQLRPNNLVMWRAIEWHVQHGSRTLDFGRTALAHEGLRHFKAGWGAREELIGYVRYDPRHNRFLKETLRTDGWHTRVFRILPLSVSRVIGRAAYKHIA